MRTSPARQRALLAAGVTLAVAAVLLPSAGSARAVGVEGPLPRGVRAVDVPRAADVPPVRVPQSRRQLMVTRASTLDPGALFFDYMGGVVNVAPFAGEGLATFAGYQYAAWYGADRRVVLARRELPAGPWRRLVLPHDLSRDDAHNVISLGVSPKDGRLHVAMDTHISRVFYVVSAPGLVTRPRSVPWSAASFGPVQQTLGGVDLGGITYPQFAITPSRDLQLSYRTGHSGGGVNELAIYRDGRWRKQGAWTSRAGSYSDNGATSTDRNMYLHGFTYHGKRLFAAYTWREGNRAVVCSPGGLSNHDTGFVYSDDEGRSWHSTGGRVVAVTGRAPVDLRTPGAIVAPLDTSHALINQESQAVDSSGGFHVVISYVPDPADGCVRNYVTDRVDAPIVHLWRTPSGAWHRMTVPGSASNGGRSQLAFDRADNAYLVLSTGTVLSATRATGWTDWTPLFAGSAVRTFGEIQLDRRRLLTDGVLSIVFQEPSHGSIPSALRVLDLSPAVWARSAKVTPPRRTATAPAAAAARPTRLVGRARR